MLNETGGKFCQINKSEKYSEFLTCRRLATAHLGEGGIDAL